jgi:hypothetical protein
MSLGNVRELGARGLAVYCLNPRCLSRRTSCGCPNCSGMSDDDHVAPKR